MPCHIHSEKSCIEKNKKHYLWCRAETRKWYHPTSMPYMLNESLSHWRTPKLSCSTHSEKSCKVENENSIPGVELKTEQYTWCRAETEQYTWHRAETEQYTWCRPETEQYTQCRAETEQCTWCRAETEQYPWWRAEIRKTRKQVDKG